MQNRIFALIGACMLTTAVHSQTDYNQWLTTVNVGDKSIQVLRIGDKRNQFSNTMTQMGVYSIETTLDEDRKNYTRGERVQFGHLGQVEAACMSLEKEQPGFPVKYYQEEARAYREWSELKRKQEIEESNARAKRYEDSMHVIRLKEGYRWINADTAWVRSKADPKSPAIGRLYRLSYVKAWAVEGKPDWVELEFGEHEGFIKKSDLGMKWEDMNLTEEEENDLKRGRYYSFDPVGAYKAKLAREAAEEERQLKALNTAPKRTYYWGPKGGCYWVDSRGNKHYMDDKSLCN